MSESIRDAARPFTGGALAASLSPTARLFGLGEPTHGVEVFLELRNELFRHLVEHQGCRSIALESDCLAGLAVDAYVTDGTGTLDDVMGHGFSHGFGASAANRELVRWMRAYNEQRPSHERLHFYGFDGPLEITGATGPRPALTALLQRDKSHLQFAGMSLEWWSAGAIIATRLGDRYSFAAATFGSRGSDVPRPDTLEGLLETLPHARAVIDPDRLNAALDRRPALRVPANHTYLPLDPATIDQADAIVFVREI